MATVRAFLRNRKNEDGTQPLVIRIYKDKKVTIIHLGYHIKKKDWDEKLRQVRKSHPNSVRLNNLIATRIAEVSGKVITLEADKEDITVNVIKKNIRRPKAQVKTFFVNADLYLELLKKEGKYNQYTADKPRIKHFRDFMKGLDPQFADVDVALLTKFRTYLKSEYKTPYKTKPRLSERSIINHFVAIRSVFSFARKAGVIDRKTTPFGEDGIKIEFPESVKIGLNQEEVMRLEKVKLDDEYKHHCRNLWLYSFYFGGMRVADVLLSKWSDFQDGRLHYIMGKNDKAGSLKVNSKVEAILDEYREKKKEGSDLIFPELRRLDNLDDDFVVQRTIAFAASAIDKCLRDHVAPAAKITKKLTMHIARHTFGNLSGEKVAPQLLQQIYRHSDIKTTIGYQKNFIHEGTDSALEAVIGF